MTIQSAIEQLRNYKGPDKLSLNPGADEAMLQAVENAYNITLPDDFKEFYRFTDGFESDEDIFNMIPLAEIINNKDKDNNRKLYIAEYMIYSDMWELEINPDNSNDYKIVIEANNNKIVFTNSLAEFISRFLKGGVFGPDGIYEWQQKLELQPVYATKHRFVATWQKQQGIKGNLIQIPKKVLALAVMIAIGSFIAATPHGLSFLGFCFIMRAAYNWWVARKK